LQVRDIQKQPKHHIDSYLDKLLDKDVAKERITKEQAAEAKARLQPTTKIEDLKDVDFVIEAVPVKL
jgi:3-hydroxybutyryl-CoA dehydrogenase